MFPIVAAFLVCALAASEARAAAVTPPDKPVLIDTSSSAGSVVASSSSADAFPPANAFDGLWSASEHRWLAYINPSKSDYTGGKTGETPAYVIYRFNAPTKVNVLRLRIPNDWTWDLRAPKAWTFLGSNDGSTWTQLDARSGVTWTAGEVKDFSFENDTKYAYYKFNCTEISGENDYMQLYEIQFLYDAGIVLTDLTTAASGSVSSSSGTHGSYPATKAFDGNRADTNGRWLSSIGDHMYLVYRFNDATAVNAIRVWNGSDAAGGWNSTGRAPKTWTFSGSNDGETWTTLDTQTSETDWAANGESRYYAFENNTPYEYYKYDCTALNGGTDYLQLWELEFFYVNTGSPALGIVSLSRTGAAEYSLSATEDVNAADISYILSDGETVSTNGWQFVAEGNSTTWTISGLTADKTYAISVLATNENGTAEADAGTLYTGVLSLGATTDANEKGLVAGGVTVSRVNDDSLPLTVNYTISGSAGTEGTTWEVPVAVTIPANAASAVLPVVPLDDTTVDEDVTITVTLLAGNYELPATTTATLTLRNRVPVEETDFVKKMTLTPSATALAKIGEGTFANFPVLVRLPAEVSGELRSANGTDIFFKDENNASLPFEVDTFNPAGETLVWVRVPSLSSATELTVSFGGYANADNDPTAVWTDYAGVWHMNDAAGRTADSTANANNGTDRANVASVSDGAVGKAKHTSNANGQSDDKKAGVRIAQSASLNVAPVLTMSMWYRPTASVSGSWAYLFAAKNSDSGASWGAQWRSDKIAVAPGGSTENTAIAPPFDAPTTVNAWTKLDVTISGNSISVYTNGALSATKTSTSSLSNGSGLALGSMLDNGYGAFVGDIDETRLRGSVVDATWAAVDYQNQSAATLFDAGDIELTDPTAQKFATPTAARNGNGSYTVTVVLTENNGDVGVIYDAGSTAITNIIQSNVAPNTYTDTPANLTADTTYAFAAYGKNANDVEVVKKGGVFYNGELSVVKVSDAAENNLVPGVFRISRADTAHDLTVSYTVGGTAAAGQTYAALSGTATIPAGSTSVDVEVVPMLDAATTEDKTVALALAAGLYGIDAQAGSAEMTLANLVVPAGFNTWVAAADGLASVGSNWSEGHAPLATEKVLFDGRFSTANCEWDSAATATVASWTQTNDYTGTITVDTVFPEKGAFTCLTISGNMNIAAGSITHKAHTSTYKVDQYRLRIDVVGDLTVASGAKITARGKGSYGARAEGASSYGGSYNGNASWGSLTEPYGVGSSANGNATIIAFAGGAIWLEVAGATKLDGSINANGIAAKPSYDTLGGSGGAVYLKTGTLSGAGSVSANCEQTGISSNDRSGAGGRVSILLTSGELDSFPNENLTALSAYPSYANVGSAGTVLVRSPLKPNGILFLRDRSDRYSVNNWGGIYSYRPKPDQLTRIPLGQTWVLDEIVFGPYAILQVPTGTTLDLRGGLASVSSTGNTLDESGLIVDGGTLLLPAAETHTISGKWIFEPKDYTLAGNLVVTNGAGVGTLLLYSDTSNNVRRCGLSVLGNMHVASDAYLRAVRGGYIATGATTVGGGSTSCHGGQCGRSTSNVAYDSFFRPRHPGTFGTDNGRVNVGGGVIRLSVGGTLTLDGVASATPSVNSARSGAPGSIDITAARLEGAGRIEANGNSRNYTDDDSGNSSGGGRIAVRLTGAGETFSDAWVSKINAKGYYTSKFAADRCSSAGSIYLQTADQAEGAGTIIIRNTGNVANNVAFTALPSLKAGGEDDDFRKASLKTEAAARVKLFDNLRMVALDMASDTALDLNGKTLVVNKATLGGVKLAPGAYTADKLGDYVLDSVTGGTLVVTGGGLAIIVR